MSKLFRFDLAGKVHCTKKSAQAAALAEINPQPLLLPFQSELLSDLVSRYHYYCSKHSLRPTRFRKMPRRTGGYNLEAWFEGIGWHGVSYRKCLTPPTFRSEAIHALRQVVESFVWSHRKPCCDRCGSRDRLEVNHLKPRFEEMVEKALEAADEADKAAWDRFDWVSQEEFQLPPAGKAVRMIVELHKKAIFQTLCAPCHRNVARQ